MTGDDLWRRGVRDQHNHGSGTFIGGDSIRIEMLDENTKQLLAKVTEQAPALGKLLEQALREGVISAETAASLSMAARAINEDVAASLRMASYSINEDVAGTLRQASYSINAEVAQQLVNASDGINKQVADEISGAARDLSQFDATGLQSVVGQLGEVFTEVTAALAVLRSDTGRTDTAPTPPARGAAAAAKTVFYAFLWGVVTGAIAWAYLAHYLAHH